MLWVVLSVLVVTCPCALSLATPTAHAAALSRLRKSGLLVLNSNVFAALSSVNRIVFDKTGTLTVGEPRVQQVDTLTTVTEDEALSIVAALEQDNSHPIARAFLPWIGTRVARHKQSTASAGVAGIIDNTSYYFGRVDFVLGCLSKSEHCNQLSIKEPKGAGWLLLANDQGAIAWVQLADGTRDSAAMTVELALQKSIQVSLLSGDTQSSVDKVANQLGITVAEGRVLPGDKLGRVQGMQAAGEIVLMVGDGINDIPVLSAADVSVAMASATDLAQTKSDAVLLNGDLTLLVRLIEFSKQLQRTIKQNLAWALGYNGLALPLAVAGLVPPWAAAIGMSVSSLIVVANALRLSSYSV